MFKWVPLRIAGDLVLIGSGVLMGLLGVSTVIRGPRFVPPQLGSSWLWFVPMATAEIMWCSALILIFGRDVGYCLLRKKPILPSPA